MARAIIAFVLAVPSLWACAEPSCLDGDCEATEPCAELAYSCIEPALWIGRVGDAPGGLQLRHGQGTPGDVLLRNDQITVVLDRLEEPHDLAPTGGNILDLGPTGGRDDVNLIYALAGILPDDAFAYTSIELVDRAPEYVAAVARGTLDGRPDVEVVTRYELRPCEPGLRIRSELHNGSPDVQVFIAADAAHWGKRGTLPFVPRPGQGYLQPELDLIELEESWDEFDYVAARAAFPDGPGYGFVRCDAARLEGVNDPEISALGTARTLVRPGERLIYERFVITADGSGLDGGVSEVLAARRALHGESGETSITGRVVAGGMPLGGDLRRASVVVTDTSGAEPRPLTEVVPAADGTFSARVPATGDLGYPVWSFGRPVASGPIGTDGAIGDVSVQLPATLSVAVDDAETGPAHAMVWLHPADADTRAAVRGSWHGRFGACAPWLGPPHGASPACNRALVPPEGTDVEVPAGRYHVYVSMGPEHALARQTVELTSGEVTELDFALEPLAVRPPGWLSADLHVHGRASFDSSIPDPDRVRSFVAAGVDVIAATDHDHVTDYAEAVAASGLGDRVAVMGGVETTQLIPFLDVPDDDFPKVIGHFNFWPMTPDPAAPRGGAPWDERVEPGELFDIMEPLIGADGLAMLNHPWDEPDFGRDLGYLRAIGFDPREPVPDVDDGTRHGMLQRRPAGGHRNVDFDVIEVQNGAHTVQLQKTRPLWFSLLSQGFVRPGVGNSDSHGLGDNQLGYARSYVDAGTTVVDFDASAFDDAVRAGRVIAGNGVIVVVTVGPDGGERTGVGLTPYRPTPGDTVEIEVRAAPWIPVTEVRAVTSGGTEIIASTAELEHPADPFGADGLVRWTASIPLDELVADGDDWLVIEAGLPYPPVADRNDDGVPDTSDNDGDGDVDADDVEEGEDDGPLEFPRDPDDPTDPRFHVTRVVPGAWPVGFTNPILVDRAGDGWDPPGLKGAAW